MIIISNKQRDQLLQCIEWFLSTSKDNDLRSVNARRRAKSLAQKLKSRKTFSVSEFPAQLKNIINNK